MEINLAQLTEKMATLGHMNMDAARGHVDLMLELDSINDSMSLGSMFNAIKIYAQELKKGNGNGMSTIEESNNELNEWFAEEEPKAQVMSDPTPALPSVQHGEALVVIFPANNGEVAWRGVRYSVTMREGATAEMALKLLKEWARFWEMGAQYGVTTVGHTPAPAKTSQAKVEESPAKPKGESAQEAQKPPQVGLVGDGEGSKILKTRHIVAMKRIMKDNATNDGQHPEYIPYYEDETGFKAIGSFKPFLDGEKTWKQLHDTMHGVLDDIPDDEFFMLRKQDQFNLYYSVETNPKDATRKFSVFDHLIWDEYHD